MLPISENFHSIQGEGHYVGTPMHFVRLAGCPVGKKATQESNWDSLLLPTQSLCKTWDERTFLCDTDFSCHTHKTVDELIGETWEKHICLTGGEPLIHQKALIEQGFFRDAFQLGKMVHIETSGTVLIDQVFYHDARVWVTVSPKFGFGRNMISRANEIKFLVDENFNLESLQEIMRSVPKGCHIFLSPINEEKTVNQENVARTLELLRQHPNWRISAQWHKFLGVR